MKTKTRRALFWAIIAVGVVSPWLTILGTALAFELPIAAAFRPVTAVLPWFPITVFFIAAWWSLPFVAFAFLWHRLVTAEWEPLRRNPLLLLLGIPVAASHMGATESVLAALYILLFLVYAMVAIPSWGLRSRLGRVIFSLFGFGALLFFTLFIYGYLQAMGVAQLSQHIASPLGILFNMTMALFVGYLFAKPIDLLVCRGKPLPDISDRTKPSAWLIGGNALTSGLGFAGVMMLYSKFIGDAATRHEIGQFLAEQPVMLTFAAMTVGLVAGLALYLVSFAMLHYGRYRANRPLLLIALSTLPGLLAGVSPGLLGERAVFAALESNYFLPYLLYRSDSIDKIAVSPDGNHIAAEATGRLVIWDIATGEPVIDAPSEPWQIWTASEALAWSPDGSMVSLAAPGGRIAILDSRNRRRFSLALPTSTQQDPAVVGAAFSRDGKRLIAAEAAGSIHVYELASGKLAHSWQSPVPAHSLWSLALSPQGHQLAVAGLSAAKANRMGGFVAVLDETSGETLYAIDDFEQVANQLSFSPDGSLLLLAGIDNPPRIIDALTGRPLVELRHHCAPPSDPYGSSLFDAAFLDSRSVAVACSGGVGQVCDASSGDCRVLFDLKLLTVDAVAAHPDGRHAAFLEDGRTVTLWDVRTAQPGLSYRLP
jgi:hypothetical protein